jgi:hypothetical protein
LQCGGHAAFLLNSLGANFRFTEIATLQKSGGMAAELQSGGKPPRSFP